MSELPKGWVATSLAEISGGITYGFTTKSNPVGDGARLLRITDIQDYKVDWDSLPFCDDQPDAAFLVKGGDIVVARTGATTGKSYLIKDVPVPTAFASYLIRVAVSHELQSDYVWKFMQGPDYWQQIQVVSKGTAQPGANAVILGQVAIPLPPLPEQKRIVAKLDALSAKSARARTELARIETLVSRYKQAVLSKAFSGELTSDVAQADDVATIDADASVAQLWSLPDTWSWCRTDQVGRVGLGRQRSPKNHQGPQMRPYLRSANITWQGVNTSDVNEMNFDDADFKRFKLEVGDVLLNEGSGSAKEVGKPAIWRGEIADCCYQNTLLRVQPHHCSSEYAYYYFLLTARAGRFVSSTQGVNIQHIGREGLACYPFPLAPEPEQHEIVRRIESAFSKIDRLAKEAKRALELVGRLDEAILAKAFRGELVPQDQNDEPAERLLARIRAERETAPKVKRGRGRSI
jgi:type I restriction enzyme, S subunit